MSQAINLGGEEDGGFLQRGHPLNKAEQGLADGVRLTHIFRESTLRSLEQALADLALSESRLAR